MLEPQTQSQRIKILVLAANPLKGSRGDLDEEISAIEDRLWNSLYRDLFDLQPHLAVRITDVQKHLLRHKPDIVHFCGYGTSSGEIVLLDGSNGRPIPIAALENLFEIFKEKIRCVILNTCYSEKQAHAIAKHIDCVVGMSNAISGAAAISFASSFYQGLGFGEDIKTAFELGCQQIDMSDLAESDQPKLVALRSDPKTIVLTSPRVSAPARPRPRPPKKPTIPKPKGAPAAPISKGALLAHERRSELGGKAFRRGLLLAGVTFLAFIIGWLIFGPAHKKSGGDLIPASYSNPSDTAQELDPLSAHSLPETVSAAVKESLLSASEAFEKGDYRSAIDTCKRVLTDSPKQPLAELLLGKSYYNLGNLAGFEYLSDVLKHNDAVSLMVKHHHYDGILKLNDGLCVGRLTLRAQRIEFHSEDREGHDFSITPSDIYEIRDETQTRGRVSLIINTVQGGVNRLEAYNFYSPLASLRKQFTRTTVYCTEPPCQVMMRILHKLLRQIKS